MQLSKRTTILIVLIALLLTACGIQNLDQTDMESESQQLEQVELVEPTQEVLPEMLTECAQLAQDLSENIGIEVSIMMENEDEACYLTANATGENISSIDQIAVPVINYLENLAWIENTDYANDGPGGVGRYFEKDNLACTLMVISEPLFGDLCSEDEPFSVCWDKLLPEQKTYQFSLNCDNASISVVPGSAYAGPKRIEFEPGASSTEINETLPTGAIFPYVLYALSGQQMTVSLEPEGAVMVIWGEDGTVLISDHADATYWQGALPSSQDYYIDIKSTSDLSVEFSLDISITDYVESESVSDILPNNLPVGFEQLIGLSPLIPIMLPAEFPIEEIYYEVMTAESDRYEINLDLIPGCGGAGACHYGMIAGTIVGENTTFPVNIFDNFYLELENTREIALVNQTQAFFFDYSCGASCGDAYVVWFTEPYQYVLGLKGGSESELINLANQIIENSVN
jgi:hypothetical protein